jgi:phage tail sheath protein FI
MAFLHGIEHLDIASDFAPVNDVVTAVIGLIGTTDQMINGGEWLHHRLFLCKNEKDDAIFGTEGTVPEALRAIRSQTSRRGSALVFVVAVHHGARPEDVVGEIYQTGARPGARSGLKLFETAKNIYGFEPMIYIAPRFSAMEEVRNELQAIANKNEAMAYIDTFDGMTFMQALESRGTTGQFANLDEGIKLLFPHFLASYSYEYEGEIYTELDSVPMSAYMAGLRAKVDLEHGWHFSSSNHRVLGVEGMDVDLTFSLGDRNCEANLLNAAGFVTAVNMFGNGIVEWGNYSAGFPGNTGVDAFECVRRTRAIMKRAIEKACVPFIDKPFIQANVDAIRNTVNQYLNQLVGQGKLVYGKCFYRKESNPIGQLTMGHLTFDIEFTPAVPMQRLTFTYKIDLTQLANIV